MSLKSPRKIPHSWSTPPHRRTLERAGHLTQKPWATCWSSRDGSSDLYPSQYNNKAAWWSRAEFLSTLDRMQFILLFCSLWSQNLDPEWLDEIRGLLWELAIFLPVSGETKDFFHNVSAYWLVPGRHRSPYHYAKRFNCVNANTLVIL